MGVLIVVFVLLVAFAMFDLAVWLWGSNSIDGFNSQEWERRRNWRGFGGHQ